MHLFYYLAYPCQVIFTLHNFFLHFLGCELPFPWTKNAFFSVKYFRSKKLVSWPNKLVYVFSGMFESIIILCLHRFTQYSLHYPLYRAVMTKWGCFEDAFSAPHSKRTIILFLAQIGSLRLELGVFKPFTKFHVPNVTLSAFFFYFATLSLL